MPALGNQKASNSESDSSYLNILVCHKTIQALIDTGSVISILSRSCLRSLKIDEKFITASSREFILADNSKFHILGTVEIDLKLNGLIVPFNFFVADQLSDHCILGTDFLKQTQAKIDFSDGVVSFFHDLVVLPLLSRSQCTSMVRLVGKTKIPPMAQALIQVKAPPKFSNTDCYLEGTPTIGTRGLIVARSLVRPSDTNTLTCQILNTKSVAVNLKANTPIATLSYFNGNDPFNQAALSRPMSSSPHAVNAIRPDASFLPNHSQRLATLTELGISFAENPAITPVQLEQLSAFLYKNKDLFAADITELPGSQIMTHHFETTTEVPIRQRQFRLPPHLENEMQRQVDKLLDAKIITPSTSPWNSPVFLIKKPTQPGIQPKYRFLIDLRKLNSVIIPQFYPLPTMDDCSYLVGEVKPTIFSVLDQTAGYYSLPLSEDCAPKTAFSVKNAHYHWLRLPMGLNTSPACYNFAVTTLLKDAMNDHGLVYLDDLILMSPNFEHHVTLLERVFAKFRDAGLRMNPTKCAFAQEKVKFLGSSSQSMVGT